MPAPYTRLAVKTWHDTVEELTGQLARRGLDIVHPFPSRLVGEVAGQPVNADRLGLLVGNTRALWPHLIRAIEAETGLRDSPDPVDRYCTQRISGALESTRSDYEVLWAHTPPPNAYPIQALANAAGLCDIAPCRLAVHGVYGPWLALRAVAVIDVPGPATAPAPPGICAPCPAPCRPPFDAALASGACPEADWRDWLRVRDACPVGREHRYREPQLEYHYTKQRRLLACND